MAWHKFTNTHHVFDLGEQVIAEIELMNEQYVVKLMRKQIGAVSDIAEGKRIIELHLINLCKSISDELEKSKEGDADAS